MSDKKPIALLLTPVLPLPGGSGRAMRSWDWLRELARDNDVHVVVLGDASDLPPIPSDYPAKAVWPLGDGARTTRRLDRAIGLVCPPLVLLSRRFMVEWLHPDAALFSEGVERGLEGHAIERIVVFRMALHDVAAVFARRFPSAVLDLDMDDLESDTRWSVAGGLWRMGRFYEAVRTVCTAIQYDLVERTILARYRHVYLAAQEDCDRLRCRASRDVTNRPNRITMPPNVYPPPPMDQLRLLFVGMLNYPPNEEAVRFLVTRVVPELQRRLTRPWRLHVVGRHATPDLMKLMAGSPHIEAVPDAEDLAGSYAGAHVVLVPLRSGGGTKLKTLEAFAHRRPVVSTRHGVRGLGAVAGEHYWRAESATEVVSAILALAADREMANRLATAGWKLCERSHRAA